MRGRVFAGRRWTVQLNRRSAARRHLDWVGIGPARQSRTGSIEADLPCTEGDPRNEIVGVAAHAGPWLLIVLAIPLGIRR